MKIIREGKLPEKDIFLGTCTRCRCIAEAERGEISIIWGPRDQEEIGSAPCPTCKMTMHFYKKKTRD